MRNYFLTSILLTCVLIPDYASTGEQITKKEMIEEIDALKLMIKARYAPVDWKKEFSNWELEAAITEAKTSVEKSPKVTLKNFHTVLIKLFSTMKDYHVALHTHRTEAAYLPFDVKGIDGRYFITGTDNSSNIVVGDEIISINNTPVHEIVQNLKAELGGNTSETDQSKAEIFSTYRLALLGHNVPQGQATIETKSQKTGKVSRNKLNWQYREEKIKDPLIQQSLVGRFQNASYFNRANASPMSESLKRPEGSQAHPNATCREPFLPDLGKVIWRSAPDCPHYAYIYETANKKKIGYLRIYTYLFEDDQQILELVKIIERFQKQTDALVLDQMNNLGGNIFYCYALASLLTSKPLTNHKQQVILTQEQIASALMDLEFIKEAEKATNFDGLSICGLPLTRQLLKDLKTQCDFEIDQWNKEKLLSDLHFCWGIKEIQPYPKVQYTKPILMLINELDISCGDTLPALLQDNRRATLMGVRTAGAGGYVEHYEFPNRLGIASISLTGSIVQRPNGMPIENLGVQPDIPYKLTIEDLQKNYTPMIEAINLNVTSLL